MSLNVFFSFLFSAWFSRLGWMPHGGLALANTLATGLEMAGLILVMRKRLVGLRGNWIWSGTFKAGIAGGLMTSSLIGWVSLTKGHSFWLQAGAGILVGGLVYSLGLWIMRTDEINGLFQAIRARVRK